MKVQEYNNLESRDLWEYTRWTLNAAELDRLIRHLWEMGQASMALLLFQQELFLSAAGPILPRVRTAQLPFVRSVLV